MPRTASSASVVEHDALGESCLLHPRVVLSAARARVHEGPKDGLVASPAGDFCAFSGQEDNQYPPVSDPNADHAQSWGQIPKAVRDQIAPLGFLPGQACNPNIGPPPE
jgi:hypothetical protein